MLAGMPQAPSDYSPFLNPSGDQAAPQRGAGRWPTRATSRQATAEGRQAGPRAAPRPHYEQRPQHYVFDYVQTELIKKYGARRRRARAASRSTRRSTRTCRRWPRRRSPAPPGHRGGRALVSIDPTPATSSRWRRRSPTTEPVQPRRPGRSPAGLLVQALRADDGGHRPGHRPGHDVLHGASSITLYPDGPYGDPWTVASDGSGSMNLRDATRELGQHRLRPARASTSARTTMDDMAQKLGITSPALGLPRRCSATSDVTVLDQVERVRDLRQRRRPPRPDRDRQGRLPQRRHRRAARRRRATA